MADERNTHNQLVSYVDSLYSNSDSSQLSELLAQARTDSDELGHTGMSLSSLEGRMLASFVRMRGCKKFVEIGTLTGYSALWILSAMPGGSFYALEREPKHFAVAQKNLGAWNGETSVQVLLGDALENLEKISSHRPFDGVFIDADKSSYCKYLDWAEKNVSAGGLIIADNTLLDGMVLDPQKKTVFSKKQVEVLREFNQRLADAGKYNSMILPTFAGMTVAIKKF